MSSTSVAEADVKAGGGGVDAPADDQPLLKLSPLVPVVVATALFIQHLDGAVINTSMPQMARAFAIEPTQMSMGIIAYTLCLAAVIPVSAWISDRLGPRVTLAGAIVVFTLASLSCGAAQSLTSFTLSRAVQGAGAALMAPVGRVVMLRGARRADILKVTAMFTWPALIAPVIGPAIGGLITSTIGWRWIFFCNVPLGLIGGILAATVLPRRDHSATRPFDLPGFILTAVSLATFVFGVETIGRATTPAVGGAMIAVGVVGVLLSIRHFMRVEHPLLDLNVFRVPTFRLSSAMGGTTFRLTTSAMPFLLPLFMQLVFKLSPWQSGLMTLVYFAGNLSMKPVTRPLLRRFGFRGVLVGNGFVSAALNLSLFFLDPQRAIVVSCAILYLLGLSRSMQMTSINGLALSDVPDKMRPSASTLMNTMSHLTTCLGVSGAAMLLEGAKFLRGGDAPALADFRVVFVALAVISAAVSCFFLRLSPDAGAEVSRHKPRRA